MENNMPASRPQKFVGPLAFNQRSLSGAFGSFFGIDEKGEAVGRKPIKPSELANVLMLLESIAMSNGMFIDGLLPPKDLEKLNASRERLSRDAGVPLGIEPIKPSPEELPGLFKEAGETASLSIQHFLDDPSAYDKERPLPDGVDRFESDLTRAAEGAGDGVRKEIASGIVDAAGKGKETYRGSKCVAALLLAEPECGDLLPTAAKKLREAQGEAKGKIASGLVNRFRINYINSLAGKKDAAYLADGSIEDLKGAQVMLFWRYLMAKLAEMNKFKLPEGEPSVFDTSLASVPLGISILLNTEGERPEDLLIEAQKMCSRSFCKIAAEHSPQERFLQEMTPDEFAEFQETLFKGAWRKLIQESERESLAVSVWRRIRLPAVLGAGLGAALGALPIIREMPQLAELFFVIAGPTAGAAAGFVTEDFAHGRFKKKHAYVDHFRKIEQYVSMALKQNEAGISIADAVERIFRRPLAN